MKAVAGGNVLNRAGRIATLEDADTVGRVVMEGETLGRPGFKPQDVRFVCGLS